MTKREGMQPCLMVGHYNRDNRPRESTITARFLQFQGSNPGFFQRIEQSLGLGAATEVFFIPVPYDNAGRIDDSRDPSTLCRQFICIKEGTSRDIYKGDHFFIDQAKYDELERISDFKAMADAANDQNKETNTSSCGTTGKRSRVDPLFTDTTADIKKISELRSALDTKTQELELLKTNYSALQRSAFADRKTAQTAIDELATAGAKKDTAIAEKDTAIERLTTSNAEKDSTIRALESLTTAYGSIMDQLRTTANDAKLQSNQLMEQLRITANEAKLQSNQLMHLLQTTANDAKLQSAQHTNDIETKIDQVRTAVISRAEGTGRQIASLEDSLTTALDSHWETMVAEMERVMQEKGACEQHIMEQCQQAIAKANSYAQTKKGVFTRKLNQVKRAFAAKIRKLETELMVETRLRQCVIDNFFELIPLPADRQT